MAYSAYFRSSGNLQVVHIAKPTFCEVVNQPGTCSAESTADTAENDPTDQSSFRFLGRRGSSQASVVEVGTA